MPNSLGSWGAKLSEIADAVWTRTVRQLSDAGNIATPISDAVWTRSSRQLSDVENVKTAIADSVWTRSVRDITNVTAIRDAVWAATTRTLTAGVDLSSAAVSAIWSAATRTLTGAVDILQTAADKVWNSATRTVTNIGPRVEPSSVILAAADTERSTTSTTLVKLKEIKVLADGLYRVSHEVRSGIDGYYTVSQIYKNGVAYGIQHKPSSVNYTPYSEDLAFNKNDLVQLYVTTQTASSPAYIRNFRVTGNALADWGESVTQVITD